MAPGASAVFPVIRGSFMMTVVPPFVSIASTTRSVPIGAAACQHRYHKKNGQENQQGFSHCLSPFGLFLKPGREVLLRLLPWNERGRRNIQCLIDNHPTGTLACAHETAERTPTREARTVNNRT